MVCVSVCVYMSEMVRKEPNQDQQQSLIYVKTGEAMLRWGSDEYIDGCEYA